MERFLSTLHIRKVNPLGEDKLLLKGARDGGFFVKRMYRGLDHSPGTSLPFCFVWNSAVPPKIGFFAWEASWGKVLTLNQLMTCGVLGSFKTLYDYYYDL